MKLGLRRGQEVLENPVGIGGIIAGLVVAAVVVGGIVLYEKSTSAASGGGGGGPAVKPVQLNLVTLNNGQPQTVNVGDTIVVTLQGAPGVTWTDTTSGGLLKLRSTTGTVFTYDVVAAGVTTLSISLKLNGVAVPGLSFAVPVGIGQAGVGWGGGVTPLPGVWNLGGGGIPVPPLPPPLPALGVTWNPGSPTTVSLTVGQSLQVNLPVPASMGWQATNAAPVLALGASSAQQVNYVGAQTGAMSVTFTTMDSNGVVSQRYSISVTVS